MVSCFDAKINPNYLSELMRTVRHITQTHFLIVSLRFSYLKKVKIRNLTKITFLFVMGPSRMCRNFAPIILYFYKIILVFQTLGLEQFFAENVIVIIISYQVILKLNN